MTTELLPCPFCGGDELSHGWDRPGWDGREMTGNVQCHSCDAFVLQDSEAEAIAAWNQRATATTPSPDLVEALKEARLQLEYMDGRSPSGTTPAVIAKIDDALAKAGAA